MPVTGDLTRNASVNTDAVATPFTIVAAAALADKADPVNLKHYSGKNDGAGFVVRESDDSLALYLATGSEPTDEWLLVGGTVGDDDVTPA